MSKQEEEEKKLIETQAEKQRLMIESRTRAEQEVKEAERRVTTKNDFIFLTLVACSVLYARLHLDATTDKFDVKGMSYAAYSWPFLAALLYLGIIKSRYWNPWRPVLVLFVLGIVGLPKWGFLIHFQLSKLSRQIVNCQLAVLLLIKLFWFVYSAVAGR